jgi:hypothetical protein
VIREWRRHTVHVDDPLTKECRVVRTRGCGHREQRVAVIARRERDDLLLPGATALHPELPRELERRFDGLGPAREEVDVVQIAGRERGELGCERLGGPRCECCAREIGNACRLLADCVRDLAHAVADVRDEGTARSVEVPLTLVVPQVAPFPPDDLGKIPIELPVEDVTVGIAMRGSDRAVPGGEER